MCSVLKIDLSIPKCQKNPVCILVFFRNILCKELPTATILSLIHDIVIVMLQTVGAQMCECSTVLVDCMPVLFVHNLCYCNLL